MNGQAWSEPYLAPLGNESRANLDDTRLGADTQSEDVRQLATGCVVAFAGVAPAVVAPDVTADLAVACRLASSQSSNHDNETRTTVAN